MEPSYQTRKIIGRVAALCCAALLAVTCWMYLSAPLLQQLAARQDAPVSIVFFTKPAMRFVYNPALRKAVVTVATASCQANQLRQCFNGAFDFFYIPAPTAQTDFWAHFKTALAGWRYQPGIVLSYIHQYINAYVQRRTNIGPAYFAVLSLELAELTAADFAVEQPAASPKKKQKKHIEPAPAQSPLPALQHTADNQPLKVIILNASGKKGLAESLKQYLRAQYAKGLLQVDVYDTGNYPSLQEHSFIEDYSGRLVQVTQISHAIGITGEIHSEKPTGDVYYDSRLVLGKDFKMPL